MDTFFDVFWLYLDRAVHLKVDAWAVAISFLFLAGVSVRAYKMSLLVLNGIETMQTALNKQKFTLKQQRQQDMVKAMNLPTEVSMYVKSLVKMNLNYIHELKHKDGFYDLIQQRQLYSKIKIYKNSVNLLHSDIDDKARDEFYHYMIEIKLNFPPNIANISTEIMHLFMLTLLQRHNLAHLSNINENTQQTTEQKQNLYAVEKNMIDLLNQLEKKIQIYLHKIEFKQKTSR